MRKSSSLYWGILTAWGVLAGFFAWVFIKEFSYVEWEGAKGILTNILLVLNGLFIAYFWLNGTKDIIYTFVNHLGRSHFYDALLPPELTKSIPSAKVLLLYCTCNDFNANSLEESMKQTHKRCKTVILDDSDDFEYMAQIDKFAKKHKITVVRREDRSGFKGGNLNNYLNGDAQKEDWDYFVILDSDEIIPPTFCKDALKYFNAFDNIGIVQGNHVATRDRNKFMSRYSLGVDSHWATYQIMKGRHGFMSLLGHGAMISRECFEDVGEIPEVVAEDISFSIEARDLGYLTAFAPNIVCEEEFPVDYCAFKKRHKKWTQGNLEFIKKYTGKILGSDMHWFEKLDIFLFAYSLPLTAVFSIYVFLNILIFPLLGYTLHYPVWLIVPTIVFFFAPTMNDIISWIPDLSVFAMFRYLWMSFLLYGSVLFMGLKASFTGLFGRHPVFVVTPKSECDSCLSSALKMNWQELVFAGALSAISIVFCHSILPVILLVVPTVSSVFLTMYGHREKA